MPIREYFDLQIELNLKELKALQIDFLLNARQTIVNGVDLSEIYMNMADQLKDEMDKISELD